MDNLISKWKKLINNDKPQKEEPEIQEVPKKNLASSQISNRSDRSNIIKNKFLRTSSDSNMLMRSNSTNQKAISSPLTSPKVSKELLLPDNDKIIPLLSRTIAYIQKSQENCIWLKVTDNLNEIMDLYVENLNNVKLITKRAEEKELINKTKYDTAEKMMKDYELKFLTCEKEKTKLKRQLEEVMNNYEDLREKSELFRKRDEMIYLLESNNNVLIKANEGLTEQLSEQKQRHASLVKKFEEEISIIRERLEFYKSNLNKVCSVVYEGASL